MKRKILKTVISIFFLANALTAWTLTTGQTVKGKVVDIETGEPLIGAAVVVEQIIPKMGTTTNENGGFILETVPLGRWDISISYVGYETAVVPQIMITSGKETVLEIGLKERISEMAEVVVRSDKSRPLNSMASISARSFSVEETRRYAGGIDDPARLVSAFSGVTTGNIQDNSIIVRGNAPQGVAWRLEGIEIPTPHHFAGANVTGGGMVTLFSSQMMANSDFYTSAFPAEYGNALAAVFDMKLRTGNTSKHEHTMQIGLLGIDVASEGPLSKKSGASYLFNYRYSTFGLLADLKLIDTEQLFKYQDLSFKFNFPTKGQVLFRFGVLVELIAPMKT